ncbi:MAG UNVERIFIED_CONTAM: hypothetical protein LVR29_06590 [Microcystis novacekii LVE1205-3]
MLRSEVVSGWPGLEVEGYSDRVTGYDFAVPQNKLKIIRRESPIRSDCTLFVCGEVKTLDISIKASSVNCGVNPIQKGAKITKGLRKLDGGQMDGNIDVPFRNESEE